MGKPNIPEFADKAVKTYTIGQFSAKKFQKLIYCRIFQYRQMCKIAESANIAEFVDIAEFFCNLNLKLHFKRHLGRHLRIKFPKPSLFEFYLIDFCKVFNSTHCGD